MSAAQDLDARKAARQRARRRRIARSAVLSLAFAGAMTGSLYALGQRAADGAERDPLAERQPPAEPETKAQRAEIVDRNGVALAVNVTTYELYVDGRDLTTEDERAEAIAALAKTFPDLSAEFIAGKIGQPGARLLRRPLTPREAQAAHDLGIPGLFLTPRRDRLYPAGPIAAHVVGRVNVDGQGVAGVEAALDERLRAGGPPLELTIDLRVQNAVRETLAAQIRETKSKAGAAIVLDARSGELRSLVSLPDFDPHKLPPQPKTPAEQEASPLFHRAVAGRYELGSVMKTITWALALETGVADMLSVFDASKPLAIGRYEIEDDHPMGAHVSFWRAFTGSSNIVAAKLAIEAGQEAQNRLFAALGLKQALTVEQIEARGVAPKWSTPWTAVAAATAAYGHGVSLTPLQLAAVGASLVNGGLKIDPTLLPVPPGPALGARVVGPETSKKIGELMRGVVAEGTGRRADAPGLEVGGKTGTADKPSPRGGYHDDRVVATFLAAFPMSRPRYVVVVTLDEPEIQDKGERHRGAGRTAAPAARAIIERVAPLLGVAPAGG